MEWKVKRRQDGTRYIVRRPIRNRLLRNRALRITEERNDELTTEDDTISEVKIGRYWTKEERKKHMEKSRERRNRQELVISTKQLVDDNKIKLPSPGYDLISGQKKILKKKNNNKDDFIVQQQQLIPQQTSPQQQSSQTGLLSVTTV